MALSTSSANRPWSISSPLHNRVEEHDRPIHAWYRFVLSFPPHLVREYLHRFELTSKSCVLDPFCGTGTTLVESKKHGIASVGLESNPMAHLASSVKVSWHIDEVELLCAAHKVVEHTNQILERDNVTARNPITGEVAELRSLFGIQLLPESESNLLLTGSISPLPLHKALVLRMAIEEYSGGRLYDHMRLAFAWTLVNSAGNLRFGPEVGITRPKQDAPVIGDWFEQVRRMCEDLETWKRMAGITSHVHHSDARRPAECLGPESIDAVFTSPPYPNEKDYTRTTRLESVLLGLITSKSQLRQYKESLLRSNTRNVFVQDQDHLHVASNPTVQALATEIERRRVELGKTSGFERLYHRVTLQYFGGMHKHLAELRPHLKRGAKLGYVVGDQASYFQVHIPTAVVLAEIAEQLGYSVKGIDLFRTRAATATKSQLNEEVLLLEWPGGL